MHERRTVDVALGDRNESDQAEPPPPPPQQQQQQQQQQQAASNGAQQSYHQSVHDEPANGLVKQATKSCTASKRSPYDRANIFQRYTLSHLRQLRKRTQKLEHNLTLDDFNDQTPDQCLSTNAVDGLNREWPKELKKEAPKLLHAIVRAYGLRLTFGWLFFVLSESLFEPFYFYYCIKLIDIIRKITQENNLKQVADNSTLDQNVISVNVEDEAHIMDLNQELYSSAIGFLICIAMMILMTHPYMWIVNMVGLRMRAALGQMIFKKSLKVDKFSQKYNYKQAISLISKDLDLIEFNLAQVVWIITGPIECVIVTLLLVGSVGYETASISVLISMTLAIIRSYGNALVRKYTRAASAQSDIRVSLVNETLKAIRVLRMYAWTGPLYERIKEARAKESASRMYKVLNMGYDSFVFFSYATAGPMITLAFAYFIIGTHLSQAIVSQVFIVTMIHQRTLSRYVPQGLLSIMDLMIVFERIGKYLCAPEITDHEASLKAAGPRGTLDAKNSIEVHEVCSKWLDSERLSLDRVSLSARPGELVMIVGQVGAGKSSLLQTILNELTVVSGSIRLNGTLSYASQEAWVYSGTIRDNILFGGELDMPRYLEVLRVCGLLQDLGEFSSRDLTLVGQRGITLSGGQKARINLARCLYQEADVYLLDDPLSAVDAHVSKHIFNNALRKFLYGRTILLVTHQLQYLRFADKLVVLSNDNQNSGSTSKFGSLDEFRQDPKIDYISKILNQNATSKQPTEDQIENISIREATIHAEENLLIESIARIGSSGADPGQNEMRDSLMQIGRSRFIEALGFYINESGSSLEFLLFAVFSLAMRFGFIGVTTWLTYWAGIHNEINEAFGDSFVEQKGFGEALIVALLVWLVLVVTTISRAVMLHKFVARAAKRIHDKLMRSLLWAKMRFYDLTPPGQVINRVAADLSYMDTTHVSLTHELSLIAVGNCCMFLTIALSEIRLALGVAFVGVVAYAIFTSYVDITNKIKQVDGIRKGEIYTHLSITLDGLSTIRASGKSNMFSDLYDQAQDRSTSAAFLHLSAKRLIITRLDWAMIVFYVSLIAVDVVDVLNGGGKYAFIALNIVTILSRNTQNTFTKFVELYTRIEALSRIKEYCNVEPEISEHEAQLFAHESARFKEGRLEFVGVSLRYERTGDFVLRNVSFALRAREKVGIVGRTGAGKSSLIAVLFRLYHFEGLVEIDGQDTKNLPLDSLRRSVSIIPQDPELLSGSLRRNLDPLDEHSDESLWRALEAVRLRALVAASAHQLQLPVSDSGANFSVGQRQLICLARAILRRNKLLVLDEATANVDPETDGLIQRAIRSEFAECTVLTVAHKLSTIVDSDRIMVIDKGRLVEFDTPGRLLEQDGLFASMIHSSGLQAEHLKAKIRATAS